MKEQANENKRQHREFKNQPIYHVGEIKQDVGGTTDVPKRQGDHRGVPPVLRRAEEDARPAHGGRKQSPELGRGLGSTGLTVTFIRR